MRPESTGYYASYLGFVNEQQYHLLGHFFEHNGPERVIARFPFLMCTSNSAQLDLGELVSEIQRIGSERFISSPETIGQLPPAVRGRWEKFQGTVAQILAESGLDYKGETKNYLFFSNQQIVEAASLVEPSIQIPTSGFNLSFVRDKIVCPNGFRVDISSKDPQLDLIYQYQSRAANYYQQRIEAVRKTYTNPKFKWLLAESISELTDSTIKQVGLPRNNQLTVKLVILQGDSPVGFRKGSVEDRKNILTLDIPNMRNLAYFVLDTMTDVQTKDVSWQNRFTKAA